MAADDLTEYDRWESRYRVPEYAFGTAPNYFLGSCKALLPRSGKALAVADGEGRNGVWLAEQGLDVLSIRVGKEPYALRRTSTREGPGNPYSGCWGSRRFWATTEKASRGVACQARRASSSR